MSGQSETRSSELHENAPGLALPPRVAGMLLRSTGLFGLFASLLAAAITLFGGDAALTGDTLLTGGLIGLHLAGVGTALLRLHGAQLIDRDLHLRRAALACRLSLVQMVAVMSVAAFGAAAEAATTLTGGAILPTGLIICFAYAWSYGKIMARADSLAGA